MSKQVTVWTFIAGLCASLLAVGSEGRAFPPSRFKVGFVEGIEIRTGTPIGDDPLVVAIFYPVNPGEVTDSTPRATYRLNPLRNNWLIPSALYDDYGVEPVYVNVPVSDAGPFPLVVYSHGYAGNWMAGVVLAPVLAAHGYVVALLGHSVDRTHALAPTSVIRAGDIDYVLERMLTRNGTAGDPFEGAIDAERIALSGFSLGGYVAMAKAGGDDDVCDLMGPPEEPTPPSWACVSIPRDPRIKALVLLDGSNQLLWFDELARVQVPVIGIGRSFDASAAEDGIDFAPWQARQHAAFSSTPRYRVDIAQTVHSSFAIVCENQTLLWRLGYITEAVMIATRTFAGCLNPGVLSPGDFIHPIIVRYAVAFLDTHLAGRPGLQWMLTPGHALVHEPLAEFFVTEPHNVHPADEWEFGFFVYQPGGEAARAARDAIAGAPVPFLSED